MIDTHTHLYLSEFCADGDSPRAAVGRAVEAGVGRLVMPNVDLATIAPLRSLADQWPSAVVMAMGLHPTEVGHDWPEACARVEAELTGPDSHRFVAVGEIGIDLYWDTTGRDHQMDCLDRQSRLGANLGLPLIIHCRNGLDETIEVLEGLPAPPPAIVMHCFGGTPEDVDTIRRRLSAIPRIFFGIGGVVTFKKSTLPATLPAIGLDSIVLETDSPYLAPVPYRGRRNESAYLPAIATRIGAELLPDLSPPRALAAVEAATDANAMTLFPRLAHLPSTPTPPIGHHTA